GSCRVKFGPVALAEADGAILAHSARHPNGVIRKGKVLTGDDIRALAAAGVREIAVARLEPGDVHENEAAERIAHSAVGSGIDVEAPFTGRSNLHAKAAGVLVVDRERV